MASAVSNPLAADILEYHHGPAKLAHTATPGRILGVDYKYIKRIRPAYSPVIPWLSDVVKLLD